MRGGKCSNGVSTKKIDNGLKTLAVVAILSQRRSFVLIKEKVEVYIRGKCTQVTGGLHSLQYIGLLLPC